MKATLDRIEGDTAVLLIRNGKSLRLSLPLVLLPESSKEGDTLDITITSDDRETEKSKARVSGMIEQLKKKSRCGPEIIQPEE